MGFKLHSAGAVERNANVLKQRYSDTHMYSIGAVKGNICVLVENVSK